MTVEPTRPSRSRRPGRGNLVAAGSLTLAVILAVVAAGVYRARALETAREEAAQTETAVARPLSAEIDRRLEADMRTFGSQGPDRVVAAWLRAVAAGRAETAMDLAGAQDRAGGLITDAVYGDLDTRPADATVGQIVYTPDSASATVTYGLGAREVTEAFDLTRDDQGRWALTSPHTGTVQVSTTTSGRVKVGGLDVTDRLSDGSAQLPALPGIYPITYTDPGKFYEAPATTVEVTPDTEARVSITPTVRASIVKSATKQATRQAKAWMDQCVTSRLRGATCSKDAKAEGAYIADKAVISVAVERYPTITLTWNAADKRFTYSASGTFKTTGYLVGGGTGSRWAYQTFHGTVKWKKDGTITMTRVFDD